jgi:hypothetical protein
LSFGALEGGGAEAESDAGGLLERKASQQGLLLWAKTDIEADDASSALDELAAAFTAEGDGAIEALG